jgi:molybdate-binding protein/DNA-binding XRE family transcriptional regulator
MIMANNRPLANRLKKHRLERGWSQAELAERAGISRASVSAVEINRLIPSVAAALALARTFACSVEDLFGGPVEPPGIPRWAWPPGPEQCRYWQAAVGGQNILYPVETTPAGVVEHDGVFRSGVFHARGNPVPEMTLVIACCDPASTLLAAEINKRTGLRVIILARSSRQALSLLGHGLIHVAGLHLATRERPDGNRAFVRERLGKGYQLLRAVRWQEGLALSATSAVRSVRTALRSRLRWVGREPGSGARQCQDELLGERTPPHRLAQDHRGVAQAIRDGWADAGVCIRLVSEEAGLHFVPVREEIFEYCFSEAGASDPRIKALKEVLRLASFRKLLTELPGYDAGQCGDLQIVD